MGLKEDYKKLYQHWLSEFQQTELTILNQEIFDSYKKILQRINNNKEDKSDPLKFKMFESYKQNLNYLFDDLLIIRETKITNSAFALEEIDVNNILEAEKLLYQKLISTIKGYKKVKAASIFQEYEDPKLDETVPDKQTVTKGIEDSKISSKDKESILPEITDEKSKEQIDFTLLRFLKKTPPLVGIDLLNYGPFEKENIALIPSQNANILIYEKFAEKIEVS